MKPNTIVQVATLNSLVSGNFGKMSSYSELPPECNFGLGTFENLDGEMILIDGILYQLKVDGKAYQLDRSVGTPFATISNFNPTTIVENFQTKVEMHQFTSLLDKQFPDNNLPFLVRFDGEFEFIHFRSVAAQKEPYTTLAEAAKSQTEFKREKVNGTVLGFRFPKYFESFNLPGYHLHFIDDNRQFGGHVLGFVAIKGTIKVAESNNFQLNLPVNSESFSKVDLTVDRSKETESIEGGSHS